MKLNKIQTFLAMAVVVILLSSFKNFKSDDLEKPNIKVYIETEINASADHVWEILGKQYADIYKWSNFVDTSYSIAAEDLPEGYTALPNAPVPARITAAGKKGTKVTEVLTIYNDETRELKFYGEGLPGFIKFSSDHQRVESLGDNKCKVSFSIEMKLKGPLVLLKGLVKKRFFKVMTSIQNELKVYAETGEVINVE